MITIGRNEDYFQGELYIGPVQRLPDNAGQFTEASREEGALIVGHSETGHHHVIEAADARLLETGDPLVAYLVAEGAYADLVHKRSFDTHDTIRFENGGEAGTARQVIRQREMSPAGWVRAAD